MDDFRGDKAGTLDRPYTYARVVDHINAVFRREPFFELNLFDSKFEFLYYVDNDVAMTILTAGYKTVLQPLDVVCGITLASRKKRKITLCEVIRKFSPRNSLHCYNYQIIVLPFQLVPGICFLLWHTINFFHTERLSDTRLSYPFKLQIHFVPNLTNINKFI
eukprot:gene8116-16659_t